MSDIKEILELYSVYVQTITANEQRRLQISVFYTSLITGWLALIGIIDSLKVFYITIPIFGISIVWFLSIRYFRALAKAKFSVIKELEKHFFIQPFAIERKHYKGQDNSNIGTKSKKRWRIGLAHIDMIVPLFISIISGIYLFLSLLLYFLENRTS